MKIKEVKAMSDNDLNSMIAKKSGWKNVKLEGIDEPYVRGVSPIAWQRKADPLTRVDANGNYRAKIPIYTKDLNAMYEVLKRAHKRDEHWSEKYLCSLSYAMSNGEHSDPSGVGRWNVHMATARERAEAFVLAMQVTL